MKEKILKAKRDRALSSFFRYGFALINLIVFYAAIKTAAIH